MLYCRRTSRNSILKYLFSSVLEEFHAIIINAISVYPLKCSIPSIFPETKEILLVKKCFWLVPQSSKLALVSGPVIVEANV